jgi:hypothetical protein
MPERRRHRLRLALARLMRRVAEWAAPPERAVATGPPEPWASLVRERAPELLLPPSPRSPQVRAPSEWPSAAEEPPSWPAPQPPGEAERGGWISRAPAAPASPAPLERRARRGSEAAPEAFRPSATPPAPAIPLWLPKPRRPLARAPEARTRQRPAAPQAFADDSGPPASKPSPPRDEPIAATTRRSEASPRDENAAPEPTRRNRSVPAADQSLRWIARPSQSEIPIPEWDGRQPSTPPAAPADRPIAMRLPEPSRTATALFEVARARDRWTALPAAEAIPPREREIDETWRCALTEQRGDPWSA